MQDYHQLLQPNVCLAKSGKTVTLSSFLEEYEFDPAHFVDFQALKGL
jgi:5'-3' exonuclease